MIKQYLAGIRNGVHPCGNDGTLYTAYKARWRLERLAADWARANGLDTVYLVSRPLYDPEEARVGPEAYIERYGVKIYTRSESLN